MKITKRNLFLNLLVASHCCLGETDTAPPRDYTMVDLRNGLTTTLHEVGTTSFTFTVEWPVNMEIAFGQLCLMGKVNAKARGWNFMRELRVNPTQGKATFEVQYFEIPSSPLKHLDFSKKAFFAVRVPDLTNSLEGNNRGKYEEDDESDGFEVWWTNDVNEEVGNNAEAEEGKEGRVAASRRAGHGEAEQVAEAPSSHYVWLYLGISAAFCAVLYVVRRKKT